MHSTNNYGQFVIDATNRPIRQDHVERLYNAIERKNLLREFPILVTPAGVVLDGQHRLKAAEALGVSIYYIVSTEMMISDVPLANAATQHWASDDWLNYYVNQGFPEYIKLKKFCTENPWLRLSTARQLCTYGDRSTHGVDFKNGQYKCNDLDFAKVVVRSVSDIAAHATFPIGSMFVFAVAAMLEHKDYNHSRMLSKLSNNPRALRRCVDIEQHLEMFTEIYNYHSRQNDRLRFERLDSNSSLRREDRRSRLAKERKGAAVNQ